MSGAIYEIKDLVFSYPGSDARVLSGVSLTVNEGDVISILGRNGAGKSTLLSCMLGLTRGCEGELRLLGRDLASMSEREIASAVGYVPQSHQPSFAYSVLDFTLMGCASAVGLFSRPGEAERAAALETLAELGISHLADRPYTRISGGERQQAIIAKAIVSRPRVVLFDEPTAHLDYGNQLRALRIIDALSKKGYAVVITTHNPDHALLLGGKTALLDAGGGLTAGETETVITREALSAMYDIDVRIEYMESLGRRVCVYPDLRC